MFQEWIYFAFLHLKWPLITFSHHYLIFQGFSKKSIFFVIFWKTEGNFFIEEAPPPHPTPNNVRHQFYTIKRNISFLTRIVDFSEGFKKKRNFRVVFHENREKSIIGVKNEISRLIM